MIVERHEKRRRLIATQTVLGLVSLVFGTKVVVGDVAIWKVFAAALLFGFVTSMDNPARMALIPEIVGEALIRNAITLNSTFANVGRGLGPIVAAVLINTVGVGWCFVANAASFVLVVLALLSLRVDELHPAPQIHREREQLRQGLRIAAGNVDILGPLVLMAFVGTFTYEFEGRSPTNSRSAFPSSPNTR